MQGGSFKDALKAAVISGGIGGLTAGFKGGFSAEAGKFGEGFRTGVSDAFGNVGQRFGQTLGGVPEGTKYFQNPLSDTPRYGEPAPTAAATPTLPAATPEVPAAPAATAQQGAGARLVPDGRGNLVPQGAFQPSTAMSPADATGPQLISSRTGPSGLDIKTYQGKPTGGVVTPETYTAAPDLSSTDPSLWDKTKDYLFRGGDTVEDIQKAQTAEYNRVFAETGDSVFARAKADAVGPNMLTRFGPSVALAGIGAAGAGFFDPPETDEDEDEDDDPYKDYKYTPSLYGFQAPPTYTLEDIRVPGREVGFAQGGLASLEEFPRRSGRIAGPGTERSDDVPAMLSDGEFVMTAKAVRGAGKGNRNNGMKNMYQMMRTFEASA